MSTHFDIYDFDQMNVICFSQGTVATFYRWGGYIYNHLMLVLWRCRLCSRRGIQPVKNWVVRCWHG